VSKRKVMWLALLCAALSVLFIIWQVYVCLLASLALGVIFASVWYGKHARDQQYIVEAEAANRQAILASPVSPLMTSPGSSRLFVPPPIDRN
jgi:uncharacterized protein (DUF58 family)